ncbi:MAG: metallophosphoesterase [Prevotella sp.]|nr:metallophosphoesterase [Prevotella sp.]
MWMLLFLLLPLSGIAYVAWHVYAILPLSPVWKWGIIAVGVLCFLLLFANFARVTDRLPLPLARVLYEVGTSSIFILLYLTMTFLVLDVGRLLHIVPSSWLHANATAATAIAGFIITVFLCGNIHYYNKVRVPLSFTTQKSLSRPYRVVVMSDLHLGYHNTRADLARWVNMVNAEQPDLVLIAGDIIDGSLRPLVEEQMAQEFHRIEAPVYACLGNHEFYANKPLALQFYRDANIHLLIDSAAVVDSTLVIIGRDDRTNPHRKSINQLATEARQAAENPYIILLDHQPYHLEEAERAGIDLQLSGHTHRGQVWPISWITDHVYECSWGSHRRGGTQYYISSGIGIWGGKFRIGTQSEYVVLTVEAERQK